MTATNGFFFRKTVGNTTVPTINLKVLVWMMPVIFLGIGLSWLVSGMFWVSNATQAEGRVERVETFITESGQTLYIPEFSYTLADGSAALSPLALAAPEFNFEIGSTHTILYDQTQGGPVRFTGTAFNHFGAIALLLIGSIFAIISLVLWLWVKAIARKRDQKEASL